MFPTSPYLRVRRPSPTTVEFTISTLPPLTLASRTILYLLYIARLLLGLSVLLVLYAKWTQSPYSNNHHNQHTTVPPPPPSLLSPDLLQHLANQVLQTTTPGHLVQQTATTTPTWLLLPTAAAALYLSLMRIHTSESVLVLRGLGIQTSTTSAARTVLGGAATRFIPTDKIRDVLINEAFLGFGVRYYLVVVVEGENDLVVVFPKLLPRRAVVEEVWRGVRGCLVEDGAWRRRRGGSGRVDEKLEEWIGDELRESTGQAKGRVGEKGYY